MTMGLRSLVIVPAIAAIGWAVSGCTVMSVSDGNGPARVESEGVIRGHAAVGIRAEDELLRVELLDGESDGALAEVVLWKLFRLEVGALGFGVGIGPFDFALGTAFYDADLPEFQGEDERPAPVAEASCEYCDSTPK